MVWEERAANKGSPSTLLVGKYSPMSDALSAERSSGVGIKRNKVAAFDFVSIVVRPGLS